MAVSDDYAAYLALSTTIKQNISNGTHSALGVADLAAIAAIAEEIATKGTDPIGCLLDIWTSPRHMTGINRNYVVVGDIVGG